MLCWHMCRVHLPCAGFAQLLQLPTSTNATWSAGLTGTSYSQHCGTCHTNYERQLVIDAQRQHPTPDIRLGASGPLCTHARAHTNTQLVSCMHSSMELVHVSVGVHSGKVMNASYLPSWTKQAAWTPHHMRMRTHKQHHGIWWHCRPAKPLGKQTQDHT